jgi:hypothetical protein
MAKKGLIGDRERNAIAQAYDANRRGKAELTRQAASAICGRELGLSTVQRELAVLRKKHPQGSNNPLDNQWSLGSLRDYPIHAGAIHLLIYIQETFRDNLPPDFVDIKKQRGEPLPFLTIRLAIWIARIMLVPRIDNPIQAAHAEHLVVPNSTKEPTMHNVRKWPDWIDDTVSIAMWYANYETGCELAGISPINTVLFDATAQEQMKLNIMAYRQPILRSYGVTDDIADPQNQERLKDLGFDTVLPKGVRKNARTHRKES